jgi:isopenicillin N synthase-like dioxygenase
MAGITFPVFDLGSFERASLEQRQRLGDQIDQTCTHTGFLAVANHGVPVSVITNAWNVTRAFFDQPDAVKQAVRAPFAGYPYGYLGGGTEALAKSRGEDTPPDLKESFNGGPLRIPAGDVNPDAMAFCYQPTLWPSVPEGFQAAWSAYYLAMEDLAARIMRAFAVALQLPEDYFAASIEYPISALRALNYPQQTVAPEKGQLRAGAHTDYGSLTILLPEAGSRGLEIRTPDGEWTEIPHIPGAFVINIGDLMARWTNDRWVSTLHRVVNPGAEQGGMNRRQSLAFFHQPNWDAKIDCLPTCLPKGEVPKYEPVLSGPYLMGKFKATQTPKG